MSTPPPFTDSAEPAPYIAPEERLAAIAADVAGRDWSLVLVVFLSDRVPHEVLPARRERLSIASWFRGRPRTR